jgi:hypothetical protein
MSTLTPLPPIPYSPMDWLGRLYARRIINININIIVAGLAAMLLTLIPVHATRYLGIEDKWVIIGITLGCDLAFDVAIYYALHWLANHTVAMPWSRHRDRAVGLSYFRDATLVQFERAMLGPVYYGVAVAVQYGLLHIMDREPAALLGLCSGLATTRIIHTLWMLRTERRRIACLLASSQPAPTTQPQSVTCEPPGARPRSGQNR